SIPLATNLTPAMLPGAFANADAALVADLGSLGTGQNEQVVLATPAAPSGTTAMTALLVLGASSETFQAASGEYAIPFDRSAITADRAQLLGVSMTGMGRDAVLASWEGGIAVVHWDGKTLGSPVTLSTSALLATCGVAASAGADTLRVAALPPNAERRQ